MQKLSRCPIQLKMPGKSSFIALTRLKRATYTLRFRVYHKNKASLRLIIGKTHENNNY
jgi:hypothetical protein